MFCRSHSCSDITFFKIRDLVRYCRLKMSRPPWLIWRSLCPVYVFTLNSTQRQPIQVKCWSDINSVSNTLEDKLKVGGRIPPKSIFNFKLHVLEDTLNKWSKRFNDFVVIRLPVLSRGFVKAVIKSWALKLCRISKGTFLNAQICMLYEPIMLDSYQCLLFVFDLIWTETKQMNSETCKFFNIWKRSFEFMNRKWIKILTKSNFKNSVIYSCSNNVWPDAHEEYKR